MFRIDKCMLERPEMVSPCEIAGRSVWERFALRKCRPQLEARRSCLFYKGKRSAISGASSPPPPPLRQHKNVHFQKSAVKPEGKSRPEKSSGGEGLRPPPKECSKHRALTKVRSADLVFCSVWVRRQRDHMFLQCFAEETKEQMVFVTFA